MKYDELTYYLLKLKPVVFAEIRDSYHACMSFDTRAQERIINKNFKYGDVIKDLRRAEGIFQKYKPLFSQLQEHDSYLEFIAEARQIDRFKRLGRDGLLEELIHSPGFKGLEKKKP